MHLTLTTNSQTPQLPQLHYISAFNCQPFRDLFCGALHDSTVVHTTQLSQGTGRHNEHLKNHNPSCTDCLSMHIRTRTRTHARCDTDTHTVNLQRWLPASGAAHGAQVQTHTQEPAALTVCYSLTAGKIYRMSPTQTHVQLPLSRVSATSHTAAVLLLLLLLRAQLTTVSLAAAAPAPVTEGHNHVHHRLFNLCKATDFTL